MLTELSVLLANVPPIKIAFSDPAVYALVNPKNLTLAEPDTAEVLVESLSTQSDVIPTLVTLVP